MQVFMTQVYHSVKHVFILVVNVKIQPNVILVKLLIIEKLLLTVIVCQAIIEIKLMVINVNSVIISALLAIMLQPVLLVTTREVCLIVSVRMDYMMMGLPKSANNANIPV